MDALAWHLSTISNLITWTALVRRRGWRTVPAIFWLELISALTTAFVLYARSWHHGPWWQAKDEFVTATQLAMGYAVAHAAKRKPAGLVPWLFVVYVLLDFAREHAAEVSFAIDARQIYYARLWEGLITEFFLGYCLWLGKIGDMSTTEPLDPIPEPIPVPEPHKPTPEDGPPGDPPQG